MTPTQAQDLKRLAEDAAVIDRNERDDWYTEGELLQESKQGVAYRKNARFIAAMSPDVALQLLADRAMLLEALEDAKAKLEWFVDSYPQDVATSRYDFFATIRAAISQCGGAP